MKQNTTPVVPVEILMPFDEVKRIEFIFKRLNTNNYNNDLYRSYPALVHKIYEGNEIPIQEGDNSKSFVVNVLFSAEETLKIPSGPVYMDTRIVLNDGSIPETEIVKLNMKTSLFEEVYKDDSD